MIFTNQLFAGQGRQSTQLLRLFINQQSEMSEANQTIFNNWKEFIYTQAQRIISAKLTQSKYDSLHSKEWANIICEQIIGKLSGTNHHFKYIVNCIILAAGGNGMDVAGLCYWDQEMDGSVTIKWDNKHMTCIVNIFGCAI